MVALIQLCTSRRQLVRALFGRDPGKRSSLCPENMVEWLHGEVDDQFITEIQHKLPQDLQILYNKVVQCTASAEDWEDDLGGSVPVRRVWPCWGLHRGCAQVRGAVRGGRQETLHYNEVGWLSSNSGYKQIRELLLLRATEVQYELSDLNSFGCLSRSPYHQVLYISNADQSSKFIDMSREQLEEAVAARCGGGPLLLVSTTCISLVQMKAAGELKIEQWASRHQGDERLPVTAPNWEGSGVAELQRLEVRRLLERNGNQMSEQWDMNTVLGLLHE